MHSPRATRCCARRRYPLALPFFVPLLAARLLRRVGVALALLAPLMRPLFGLSGTGAAALALGLCGGYPSRARTATELENGALSAREGSGCSPSATTRDRDFCSACAARACFRPAARARRCISSMSPQRALHRDTAHLPPAAAFRSLFRRGAPRGAFLSAAFPAAVQGALAGILNVCAFVVFSRSARAFCNFLPGPSPHRSPARCSLVFRADKRRVKLSTPTRAGFLACAALLGWGGMSVHFQTRQRAGASATLRPVLSACQGSAGAPLRHFVAACLPVSVP